MTFYGPEPKPFPVIVPGDAVSGNAYDGWTVVHVDIPSSTSVASTPVVPVVTGVNPTETSYALYGHIVPLLALGQGRIGGDIIVGPWLDGTSVSGINSFGVQADPTRVLTLVEIAFDSQVVWQGTCVGDPNGPVTPDASGFTVEPFTCRFYTGSLTQPADALETSHWGVDAVAYRGQPLLAIDGLPIAATKFRKYPYIACKFVDEDGEAVNFGELFERIAYSPYCGLTSDDFETDGITDGVANGGIIITDNIDFLSLLQQFCRFYPTWDLLQTDKLRLVDRGDVVTPDITLDETMLIDDVTVTRQGEDTRRKDIELTTIDPDADYTLVPFPTNRPRSPIAVTNSVGKDSVYLPVVMDSSTRAAVATLANYHEEHSRRAISFKSMFRGFEIEPGTRVRLRDIGGNFRSETFKVEQTLHGANYTVEITAAPILKCAIEAEDAGASFVAASDTRYGVSTTMDQDIPACEVGDMIIAAVMHRSALTPPTGWTLVESATTTYTAGGGGTQTLSLFSRVAEIGDSGSTTTWTQASSVRISVHIQTFRSSVRTLSVVDFASSNVDNTADNSIPTAIASATGDGQIGVAFATSVFVDTFLPTYLTLTMDAGADQTTSAIPVFIDANRLCGGYALLDLSEDTSGLVEADWPAVTPGGGWAAVSLVLG